MEGQQSSGRSWWWSCDGQLEFFLRGRLGRQRCHRRVSSRCCRREVSKALVSLLTNLRGRLRVGVMTSVAVRLRARMALGEVSPLTGLSLRGGMFSLLPSPSSTVTDVRGRFGLGLLSGVRSWSQPLAVVGRLAEASWWPRFPRTELRVCIMGRGRGYQERWMSMSKRTTGRASK